MENWFWCLCFEIIFPPFFKETKIKIKCFTLYKKIYFFLPDHPSVNSNHYLPVDFLNAQNSQIAIANLQISQLSDSNYCRKSKKWRSSHQNVICQCGRIYKSTAALRKHLKWECGKPPTFGCQFCEFKCKLKSNLTKHIRGRHKNVCL